MLSKSAKSSLALVDFTNKEEVEKLAQDILQRMEETQGMTIQDAFGIPDRALEEIYTLAYSFYDQGKYPESFSLFDFLVKASPKTSKYCFGLAATLHQLGFYREAAVSFLMAYHLEPENPLPAYYATDCFLKLNLKQEAQEIIEIALVTCEQKPEYAELKQRFNLILKQLR